MPELPEVETTRRGIDPHVVGKRIREVIVRDSRLRWPVDPALPNELKKRRVLGTQRRGKYILMKTENGTLVWHLGMSGSLRILTGDEPPKKHDHLDVVFEDGTRLRFHDPRRFGCALWTTADPMRLPLLRELGIEPFDPTFDGEYLLHAALRRSGPIKSMIMDGGVVVGVGNIYASESLFEAGIHPNRAACRVSRSRLGKLAETIRAVLSRSIEAGGTTLRDFVNSDGEPGYFKQQLNVYERAGEPCRQCNTKIVLSRRTQRSTYFCPRCQR